MIVGFIGFGQVASTLSNILSAKGIQTVTVVKEKNTSDLTVKANEEEKTINYPISFLYNVFFDNNTIFYLDSNNQLS